MNMMINKIFQTTNKQKKLVQSLSSLLSYSTGTHMQIYLDSVIISHLIGISLGIF